ncbi:MAG: hypothetical protein NTY66_00860 [Candidatus Vogelbacteria bacterium]|nr:hypothetical protein [Candidatus Vogelbacteria bacterium]
MTTKKIVKGGIGAGTVVGLAAAAVAATAGAYFLYGKNGAKNRKKVSGWMLKAKGEVLDQLEKGKDVTEEAYHKVIDKVSQKYQAAKHIDKSELNELAKELKGHWTSIKRQLSSKKK